MRIVSQKRRQTSLRERARNLRLEKLEERSYAFVAARARELVEPYRDETEFALAIRRIVQDPATFTSEYAPELREQYDEYRKRHAWTDDVRVTGQIPTAAVQGVAELLVALHGTRGLATDRTGR